jgi:inorganic pyrophosphatase
MTLPPTFSKNPERIYAIIESPAGSRNKYKYDHEHAYFKLKKILPSGTQFPLDFGFIPGTQGEDGDPLDILLITEFPLFTGCVIESRVIGILEAEQREKKKKAIRNDRIIAVANESLSFENLKHIEDVNKTMLDEVIHFFEYYNKMGGKKFKMIGTKNPKAAIRLIEKHRKDGKA